MIKIERSGREIELRKETYENAEVIVHSGREEVKASLWNVLCEELGADYDSEVIRIEANAMLFISIDNE